MSVGTVRLTVQGSFGALLRDARRDELLACDPIAGLEWPEQERREPEPFEDVEVEKIIAHFRRRRSPALPLLALVFWAGLRPSEAAGLTWSDVDLATGIAHVRGGLVAGERTGGKTGPRRISLGLRVVRLLSRLRRARAALDATIARNRNGEPVNALSWSTSSFQPALRQLGIQPRSFFHARHTFIIAAIERGARAEHIAAYCGVRTPTS